VFKKLLLILRLGFFSLLLHKLRAALAVLGILIGVTAVIWLVAIGEGMSNEAQRQIQDLGARNIIVRSVKPPAEGGSQQQFTAAFGLTRADFTRITRGISRDLLPQAVPIKEARVEAVWHLEGGRKADNVQLVGCVPEYFELNNLKMDRGRFLTSDDVDQIAKVVVLGAQTAERLFPGEDPRDQYVLIQNDFYKVVGQTETRNPSGSIGGSLDSRDYNVDAYVPLSTWDKFIGDWTIERRGGSQSSEVVERSQFTFTVDHIDHVEDVEAMISKLLQSYHDKQDYALVIPKELLRQAQVLRMMFNVLLVVIAGISLLVGGIGIMNIMLATVTERTREIGIRRALGATRQDIISQFLVESLVLTGIGGALGILLGLLCGPVVALVKRGIRQFPDLVASMNFSIDIMAVEPDITSWSIVVAFLISVVTGLIFGLYPAYRAAMMDPIEALRHE
jgi:putative ABC transport system permease protein